MRFSSSVLLALPLTAFAAEEGGAFGQYKAQFQNFLGSFGAKQAEQSEKVVKMKAEQAAVEPVAVEDAHLATLTLGTWKDTLYGSLPADTTTPEEWWLFVTGRNKTCNGYCNKAEAAFNETVSRFAGMAETDTPNMAMLNCDDETILCNAWGCGPGTLWIIDLLPPPAEVDVHFKRLNLSSVTADDVAKYLDPAARGDLKTLETIFHPWNSKIAELGLSVPIGYLTYYFSMVPNWLFMFALSAISRTMMTNRMRKHEDRKAAERMNAQAANAAAAK